MVNIRDILIEDVAEKLEIKKASKNKYHCFSGEHAHGDKGASLTIYNPGMFECKGCGLKGHTTDLVMAVMETGRAAARKWIHENFDNVKKQKPGKKTLPPIGKKYHLRFIMNSESGGRDMRFIELPKDQVATRKVQKKDCDLIMDVLGKKYSPATLNSAGVLFAPKVKVGKSTRKAIVFQENLPSKGILYNPNSKNRYLHLEGRTDWLTAIEIGLADEFALVSDHSKTNFHVFPGVENIFIMDEDNSPENIREHIKERSDLRFVRLPEKDLSEMFNSNGGVDVGFISGLVTASDLISVLSGGLSFDEAEADLMQYRITREDRLLEPEPLITCNGATLLSKGNIGMIAGSEGVMKSTFMRMIISGAIIPQQQIWENLADFDVAPNVNEHAVLFFDTEQSKHKQGKNLDHIIKRSGQSDEPDFLQSYDMTGASVDEFKEKFKMAIQLAKSKFGGVHMIFVDQVADLMHNTNDVAETQEMITELRHIAKEENCGIILVIHFNPGSEKERGHAGSEMRRKVEMNLNITRDPKSGIAELNFRKLREANEWDLPIYLLKYDDEKKMLVDAGKKLRTKDKGQDLLDLIFELYKSDPNQELEKKDLINHVMLKLETSKTTAWRKITEAVDLYNIVDCEGSGKGAKYTLTDEAISKMSSGKDIFSDG